MLILHQSIRCTCFLRLMLRYNASANFCSPVCTLWKLKYQCLNSGAQQSTSHPVTFMCDLARLFWTDGSCAGYSIRFHFVFDDIVIFRKIWHRLSLRTGTSSQLSLVSTDFLTGWNIVLFFHLWQHLLFLIMYQNSFMCDLYNSNQVMFNMSSLL
jgi:hypothetical protein